MKRAKTCSRKHNCLAILISLVAIVVLYINFDPTPVGAGPMDQALLDAANATVNMTPVSASRPASQARSGAAAAQSTNDKHFLLLQVLLLEKAQHKLKSIPGYTATFTKQERLGGCLCDSQVMNIKVRHEPFSVYMKWLVGDKGRELLYVDGKNEGKMLVRVGGIRGRLLPALKLDPNGSMAMKESRYPITKAGLMELVNELLVYRRRDLENHEQIVCTYIDDQLINKTPCHGFLLEYKNKAYSELYRKSLVMIDKKSGLPIFVKNFTWPHDDVEFATAQEEDEATVIEQYVYSDIKMNPQLADADFDKANKKYSFRR